MDNQIDGAFPPQFETEAALAVFDIFNNGVLLISSDMDIEHASPAIIRELGPVNGQKCYRYLAGSDESCPWCRRGEVFNLGKTVRAEYYIEKSGKHYEVVHAPFRGANGSITMFSGFRRLSGRERGDTSGSAADRTILMVRECNKALLSASGENSFLAEVCRILVDIGGYRMAWVGTVEMDHGKSVIPVAAAGAENGYTEKLNITWADTELGRGPTGKCIRSGKPAASRDIATDPAMKPWRAEAVARGYYSSVAFPMMDSKRVFGALNIYANKVNSFDDGEVHSLAGLAAFVSTAAALLRLRAEKADAERQFRENEVRYQAIIESTSEGFSMNDRDGHIIDVNKAFCAMLGYKREEVLWRRADRFISEKSMAEFRKQLSKAASTSNRDYELCLRAKDGTDIPVIVNASTIPDKDGGVNWHSFALFTDITKRKMVEERIKRLNRALITRGKVISIIASINNEGQLANEICEIIVKTGGYRMAWLGMVEHGPGKSVLPIAYAGTGARFIQNLNVTWADTERGRGPTGRSIRSGRAVVCQNVRTDPSMEPWREEAIRHDFHATVSLPLAVHGKVFGTLAIYSTEPDAFDDEELSFLKEIAVSVSGGLAALRLGEEKAEAVTKLHKSREIERMLVENSTDCICHFNLDRHFTYVNPGGLKLMDLRAARDIVGKPFTEGMADEYVEKCAEAFENARHGKAIRLEYETYGRNGKRVWWDSTIGPIFDAAGKITGFMRVSRDVTARKESERALIESGKRLEEAQRIGSIGDWTWDLSTSVITWSDEVYRIFGINKASFTPSLEKFVEFVHPADRHIMLEANYEDNINKKNHDDVEYRIIAQDTGEIKYLIVHGETVFGPDGKPLFIRGTLQDITARKLAEKAAVEWLTFGNRIIEASPMGILVYNAAGQCVSANEAASKITGGPREILLGQNYKSLKSWKVSGLWALAEEAFSTGEEKRQLTHMVTTFGRRIWVESYFVPFHMGDEQFLMLFIVVVSWRRVVEESIRESEERFRLAFDEAAIGMVMMAEDGAILRVNGAFCAFLGFTAKEIAGKPAELFSHPDDIDLYLKNRARLLSGDAGSFHMEHRYIRKDGAVVWGALDVSLLRETRDKNLRFIAQVHDITAQREAEALLRLQGEITENAAEGVIMVKAVDNIILYVNRRFETMFGFSPGELLGKHISIIDPSPEQFRSTFEKIRSAIEKDAKFVGEVLNVKKDGTVYWNAVSITTYEHHLYGKVRIAHHTDITERRLAEEEAAAQRAQLMRADRMKSLGIMVASVAHEINNPNNYILLNSDFITKIFNDARPVLDDYYREHGDFVLNGLPYSSLHESIPKLLAGIAEGGQRIKRYVEKLRDFSVQRPSTVMGPVDINRVVESAAALTENLIKKTTANFRFEPAQNLPQVNGRFYELEQVVVNLITNACQALPDRNRGLSISTSLFERDGGTRVCIVVADEGEGIPPENMERILDPLFTTRHASGGTGLGLAVSSGIIRDHGGKMEFQSEQDKGTTVTLCLPPSFRK